MTQRRIYGSMSGRQRGAPKDTKLDSMGSLDSDSDLLLEGDLEEDDDDDDDDDPDDEILNPVTGHEIINYDLKPGNEKRAVSKIERTDEDF